MFPQDERPIKTATITVDADGYFTLRYFVHEPHQMVASLGGYHESDIRLDWELTKRLEPQIVALVPIDFRPKRQRQPMEWFK